MKMTLAVLLAATMLSAPAIAQTKPNAAPAGAASTAAAPAAATPAQATASDGWRASKLIGVDVYNAQNESIGDINEVILDRSGKVTGYVIGVGGFLGMGQHDVLLPADQVKFVNEPRAMPAAAARPAAPGTGAPAAGAPAARTTTTGVAPAAPAPTTGVAPPAGTRPADTRPAPLATTARNKDERWYPDHAIVNATKEQLKNMQAFKYN